ncbi:uncharacterized protein ASPGLDRAFT_40770 [Aspergillus glaucus CBS 516.65]|uniref:Uncharacterized protein n=1 Tax=Aspergillus glaucus CBS 516.65 TaxID=1160497 RepID=A0A1L9V3G5_ASPGL|nr:hypothetical protein ASPGLDRAFT_40770 [Aspergillus glaucus CBS 516.65]OJJ78467.1 hypothetical protein ASPGLDRAFT_40770 [Aspergillus glaucus CBS 516.65]
MLRAELITIYHQLHKGRGTELFRESKQAQNKVRVERKKLHQAAKDEQHKKFFENVGNHIIEQNYQGKSVSFEPDTSHVIPERKALADLEFKNRDVDKVNDAELVKDRIHSLELRLALHYLNVPKTLQKRIRFDQPPADVASEKIIPLKSDSGLECPACLGRSNMHTRAKKYIYARKDILQRHFRTHKLPRIFPKGRECDYPGCDAVLRFLPQYMFHQGEVHKIFL